MVIIRSPKGWKNNHENTIFFSGFQRCEITFEIFDALILYLHFFVLFGIHIKDIFDVSQFKFGQLSVITIKDNSDLILSMNCQEVVS